MRRLVIALITAYQKTLSPDHGPLRHRYPYGVCKFHPTCSEYTKQAVRKYGTMKGMRLGLRRIGRCHPNSAGGFDPVP